MLLKTFRYFFLPVLSVVLLEETNVCQKYSDLLPNGVCKSYLKDLYIAQYQALADLRNKELSVWSKIVPFLVSNSIITPKEALINIVDIGVPKDCANGKEIANHLRSSVFPTKKDFSDCFEKYFWYMCYNQHKVCVQNHNASFIYNVCFETCLDVRSGPCWSVIEFFEKAIKVGKECNISLFDKNKEFFGCSYYNKTDQRDMLQCYLNVTSSRSSEGTKLSCYDGDGQNYIGSSNVTENGLTCRFWNNSYKPLYPSLEKNYCRNPQGIAARPWCYINSKGDWEYCSVPKCVYPSQRSMNLRWFFFLPLCLLLFSPLIVIKMKRRSRTKLDGIEPYTQIPLSPDFSAYVDITLQRNM